jgi:RimJ/RimL family protein N-acetyltransferase
LLTPASLGWSAGGVRPVASHYCGVVTSIRLEPFARAHLEAFASLIEDPDVRRFTRVPVEPPRGYPQEWLARFEEGRREGTREAFAIVDADGGGFLGVGAALRIDRPGRTAELGYAVDAAARGRGIATQTLRSLTDWAFADLGALRLELMISVDNEASKRVASRCGYVREGVLRSVHLKQELREDTEIWSRLPTDP